MADCYIAMVKAISNCKVCQRHRRADDPCRNFIKSLNQKGPFFFYLTRSYQQQLHHILTSYVAAYINFIELPAIMPKYSASLGH